MKHPERVEDYLAHIVEAIQRATEYIQPLHEAEDFYKNQQLQDAVIRNLEIIGEAASRIKREAPEFVTAHPDVPWIEMRGMRNKVIHDYFNVQVDVVWNTVKNDLPPLKNQLQAILQECERARGGQ